MNNALFVEQLAGLLRQLEQQYAEEAAPLEQELARLRAKYEGDIQSMKRTLELARHLFPGESEEAGAMPVPDGYPIEGRTSEKSMWVVRGLGGAARPVEVYKYIHPFDPDVSKGAVGTAMIRLAQNGKLVKVGDDPQAPYHIPVQPKHEVPTIVGASVAPRKTTTAELVLRVAKKKGRKLRKRDLVAAVIEEDPALQPLSVAALISRMAKRGDLARSKRGKFPLFGPPETTPMNNGENVLDAIPDEVTDDLPF